MEHGGVLGVYGGLMCCYCMLVAWIHGSYVGLREYRHRSHAVGRIPRKRRYARYGKGDSEIVTV